MEEEEGKGRRSCAERRIRAQTYFIEYRIRIPDIRGGEGGEEARRQGQRARCWIPGLFSTTVSRRPSLCLLASVAHDRNRARLSTSATRGQRNSRAPSPRCVFRERKNGGRFLKDENKSFRFDYKRFCTVNGTREVCAMFISRVSNEIVSVIVVR